MKVTYRSEQSLDPTNRSRARRVDNYNRRQRYADERRDGELIVTLTNPYGEVTYVRYMPNRVTATRFDWVRTTSVLDNCGRCHSFARTSIERYSYEITIPFEGRVERYTYLCDNCIAEIRAAPIRTSTRRSRKGNTYRWQSGTNMYTKG